MGELIYRSLSRKVIGEEQEKLEAWRKKSRHNERLYNRHCSGGVMREKINEYMIAEVQPAFDVFVKRLDETSQFDCRVERNKLYVR